MYNISYCNIRFAFKEHIGRETSYGVYHTFLDYTWKISANTTRLFHSTMLLQCIYCATE